MGDRLTGSVRQPFRSWFRIIGISSEAFRTESLVADSVLVLEAQLQGVAETGGMCFGGLARLSESPPSFHAARQTWHVDEVAAGRTTFGWRTLVERIALLTALSQRRVVRTTVVGDQDHSSSRNAGDLGDTALAHSRGKKTTNPLDNLLVEHVGLRMGRSVNRIATPAPKILTPQRLGKPCLPEYQSARFECQSGTQCSKAGSQNSAPEEPIEKVFLHSTRLSTGIAQFYHTAAFGLGIWAAKCNIFGPFPTTLFA